MRGEKGFSRNRTVKDAPERCAEHLHEKDSGAARIVPLPFARQLTGHTEISIALCAITDGLQCARRHTAMCVRVCLCGSCNEAEGKVPLPRESVWQVKARHHWDHRTGKQSTEKGESLDRFPTLLFRSTFDKCRRTRDVYNRRPTAQLSLRRDGESRSVGRSLKSLHIRDLTSPYELLRWARVREV
ncbi:hypothetical protein HPB50_013117 [Hyalomma asiaticum]|uniref:Uncharacterized protein n=1 Tax=Hyalomma asiaticum TaxID=266040 RepID=A0ACB7S6X1_HYAAI|nr:hypothetical protein HPB50_013117 [Hyalomma asiaticum]